MENEPEPGNYEQLIKNLRTTFESGITQNFEFRKQQLRNLKKMVNECEKEISDVLYKEFRKGTYIAKLGDVATINAEIDWMLRHFDEWAANEYIPFNLITPLDTGYVRKEPLGVVLILGTWNFPFQSLLQPFVGAIGAGNCAVLKPSEFAPLSVELIVKLIPKYMDERCYKVVAGDVEVSKDLVRKKFDYIFLTGSHAVGRSVMAAAAANLTPVTLELGGLNPVYIDQSANFAKSAKKIIWGKLTNAGLLCFSPGYVICCSEKAQDVFLATAKTVLKEWYGENPQKSPDLPRMPNKQHFHRLKNLLEKTQGTIAIGGNTDEEDLWIEPTIIVGLDPEIDILMQEEIFGPILPIIVIPSQDEAIKLIRSKPKPLSLYIFSDDKKVTKKIIESTSTGNVAINDLMWQSFRAGLPFGGVGHSGMGSYHGKASFDTFSHKRAILQVSQDPLTEIVYNNRYPPYTDFKREFLAGCGEYFEVCNIPLDKISTWVLWFCTGVAFMYFYQQV